MQHIFFIKNSFAAYCVFILVFFVCPDKQIAQHNNPHKKWKQPTKIESYDNSEIIYRIPVKLWVYNNKRGTGGATKEEVKKYIEDLNYYYRINNSGFRFYLLPEIGYINKKRHQKLGYYFEAFFQTLFHHQNGAVNVYIVDDIIKKTFGKKKYIKGTFNHITNSVIYIRHSYRSTLAHETGHFLGLKHTHRHYNRGKRKQEPVSRTRSFKGPFRKGPMCEKNGDGICDTPAEPLLLKYTDNKCKFIGSYRKDNWGDNYKSVANNIMSYPRNRKCRVKFTQGQIAVMNKTALLSREPGWFYKNPQSNKIQKQYFFDSYEPDNYLEMGTKLQYNIKQNHSFHSSYIGKNRPDQDKDIDWFKIQASHSKGNTLALSKGKNKYPELKIVLYDENKIIKKSWDIKVSSISKNISLPLLPGKTYYLKVTKSANNQNSSIFDYSILLLNK